MRLQTLLHLVRKARVDAFLEQADAAIIVVRFLLRGIHIHVVPVEAQFKL